MRVASLILCSTVTIFFSAALFSSSPSSSDQGEGWQLEIAADPASGEEIAVLGQDSATSIKDEYAKSDVTPRLEFRCSASSPTITAQIDWKRFISSFSTEAGFKVDDGRFTWLKWKVDRSEKVTMSPSSDDSQKLIDMLTDGNELQVEISPYSEGPVIATYSLNGISAKLDELRQSCQ